MKTIGIQIKGTEVILVVLEKDNDGKIFQTAESTKFCLDDPNKAHQVKQFRDQVNISFDNINALRIAILARNANGKAQRAPSPISFKLEGIIQLYDKKDIEIIWPQTIASHFKKNPKSIAAKNKYQDDAFDLAYYLLN